MGPIVENGTTMAENGLMMENWVTVENGTNGLEYGIAMAENIWTDG